MKTDEFEIWRADYCQHFPSVAAWLNSLGTELKARQLHFWAEALADVPLEVAREVTGKLYRGDFPAFGSYDSDRERTAGEVRRLSFQLLDERRRASEPEPEREPPAAFPQAGVLTGISEDFRRIVKMVESGVDQEVAMRRVLGKRYGFAEGRRYRCLSCLDTGLAWVWSVKSMHAFKAGAFGKPGTMCVAVCPCECPKGETKINYPKTQADAKRRPRGALWTSDDARYNPDKWCLCPWGDVHSKQNQEKFRAWAETFFARREKEEAERLEKEAEAEALRQREF